MRVERRAQHAEQRVVERGEALGEALPLAIALQIVEDLASRLVALLDVVRLGVVAADVRRHLDKASVDVVDALAQVVVLHAPAEEEIGEAVDARELLAGERRHAAEVDLLIVGRAVVACVARVRQVQRHALVTVVHVAHVLGQHVHVVEDEARPVELGALERRIGVAQRLHVADVHEQTAIERHVALRLHQVHAVVDALTRQKRMHVVEEDLEIVEAIAVRYDDSNARVRRALVVVRGERETSFADANRLLAETHVDLAEREYRLVQIVSCR